MQSTETPEDSIPQAKSQFQTDLQQPLLSHQEPNNNPSGIKDFSGINNPYSLYNQHLSLSLMKSYQAFCDGAEVVVIGFFKSPDSNLLDGDGKIFSKLEHSWNDVLEYTSNFDDYEVMVMKSKGKSLVH